MADDKLVFPIGFDTQSGKDDAKRDTREVLEELQKLVDKHPLKVKMEISKEDRSSMRDFADILRKMSENAKKGAKDISSFKAKMAELNKQWDKLTASQRAGAEGNALRQQYRDLAREAGGYTSTLQASVKAEDKSNQALEKKRQKLIAANAEYQKQDGYVKRLITRLGLYTAISAGVRFAKKIRETTAEFELQRVSLGALIQDTAKAEQLFTKIKEAAIKSPFEIKDLVSYTKQLAAYKIEANELFDTMMRLSDISAGLGADMSRIVLAYGQIKGAGVLKGTELRQITELGIPMVDLLAKKLNALRGELVTTGDVFSMISDKAISFDIVKQIFDDMTNAGGMFYKMQEKQAETLAGRWSNLKDSISIMYDEMGNTAYVNQAMQVLIEAIKSLTTHWDFMSSVVGTSVTALALYQLSEKRLIPFFNAHSVAIMQKIKAEKAAEAQSIKALSVGRQLTAQEQRRLALTKQLRAADYLNYIQQKNMNTIQLVKYAIRNRNNKQIMLAVRNTKMLTAEQLKNIKSMNAWNSFTTRLTLNMRSLGASIKAFGSAVVSYLPLAALTAVISLIDNFIITSKEEKKAIEELNKSTRERALELDKIEIAYRDVQKAAQGANREDTAFAKQTYGSKIEQLQKIAKLLEQYNLGNTIDFSVVNAGNIDSIFDAWVEKMREANELSKTFGVRLAKVVNAFQGTIMGWSIFGENLGEDMQDLSESWADMVTNPKFASELDRMRTYVDEMAVVNQDFYRTLSDAVGADAKIALSQKRRNESDYEYYMRVIDAYNKIRITAMGAGDAATALTQVLGGTFRSFEGIDTKEFESDVNEVMHEFNKVYDTIKDKDPLTIRMALDEQFALNHWNDVQKEIVIKELNKERLKLNLELIPTVSSVAPGNVRTGIQSILQTEFKGLFAPDELEAIVDPKSAISAVEDKMKNAIDKIQLYDKAAIDGLSNTNKGAIEEIGRLQAEINAELEKDAKDRDDTLIKTNRTQIAAIAEQNDAYLEQIQEKKDLAQAEYELAKAAKDRLITEGLSGVAEDVKREFPQLLVNELSDIKDEGTKKFLISSKDLVDIKDIGDLYDIWAKNTKAVTEEKQKLNKVGMSQETLAEEAVRLADEISSKTSELADIEEQITSLGYDELQNRYEQLRVQLASETNAKKRKKIEKEIDEVLENESYSEGAKLALTRSILLMELQRKSAAIEANKETMDFIDSLPNLENFWKQLGERWNFNINQDPKGGSREDPWIILMKNRMSYMQDFQKGVENLSQYMKAENALQQEQLVMLTRGLSLGIDAKQLKGSREELVKWFDDAIKAVKGKIAKLGGKTWSGLGVEAILSKDTKSRMIKQYQQLLQELFNQQTDFQTKKIQEDMERTIKDLSEKISRSRAAQDFFNNILGLTGNRDLSANLTMSVYGDLGNGLADKVKEQLNEAFRDFDVSALQKAITNATDEASRTVAEADLSKVTAAGGISGLVNNKDYVTLLRMTKYLPKEMQSTASALVKNLISDNEKVMESYAKLLMKFTDTAQQRLIIEQQTSEQIKKLNEGEAIALANAASEAEKEMIKARTSAARQALLGERDLSIFKLSDDYIRYFSAINTMSSKTAATVRNELRNAMFKAFQDGSISADELKKELRAIDQQFNKLKESSSLFSAYLKGGIEERRNKIREYADEIGGIGAKMQKMGGLSELSKGDKNYIDKFLKIFGKKGSKTFSEAFNNAGKNVKKMGKDLSDMSDNLSGTSAEAEKNFTEIDNIVKNVKNGIQGVSQVIEQIDDLLGGDTGISKGWAYVSDFGKFAFDGWEKFKSGDFLGAALDSISAVLSIFQNIQANKIERLNNEIKEQTRLIEDLSYAYGRLEAAQESALGSGYIQNYQQRMQNLLAEQQAYLKQAELERGKGKKSDSDKVREYEQQARDAADKITDMMSELQDYLAGTDITSAARDFASAWIDAYKEFGSTTDAINEKFADMIQNMIVEGIGAELVRNILQPIYDSIGEAAKDGFIDAKEIADIANSVPGATQEINNAMTILMESLKNAGYDIRQQTTGLTGISKDIATASEESILGLAAGINTQNFYISQIHANVAAILAKMGGTPSASGGVDVKALVEIQNQHLAYLPVIAQHTADILVRCERAATACESMSRNIGRVIVPKGSQSSHQVSVTLN